MLVYQRVNHNFPMLFRCFSHWMQNWATGGEQFDGLSTVQVDFLSRAKHVFPLKTWQQKRWIYGEKGEFMVKKVDWCRTDVELRGQNEVFPRRIMIGPGKIMFIQATLWCIQERMWLQGEHWTQRIRQTKGFVCDANVIHDGLSGDFLNKMQWARQTFFYILKN